MATDSSEPTPMKDSAPALSPAPTKTSGTSMCRLSNPAGISSSNSSAWKLIMGAAVAQWGKGVVLQPQGCRFDPRSPH